MQNDDPEFGIPFQAGPDVAPGTNRCIRSVQTQPNRHDVRGLRCQNVSLKHLGGGEGLVIVLSHEVRVEGLAARLAENPEDFEGWMRLIRARLVMGDLEQAQADLERALEVFPAETERGQLLQAQMP